jgi:hypothetical protein
MYIPFLSSRKRATQPVKTTLYALGSLLSIGIAMFLMNPALFGYFGNLHTTALGPVSVPASNTSIDRLQIARSDPARQVNWATTAAIDRLQAARSDLTLQVNWATTASIVGKQVHTKWPVEHHVKALPYCNFICPLTKKAHPYIHDVLHSVGSLYNVSQQLDGSVNALFDNITAATGTDESITSTQANDICRKTLQTKQYFQGFRESVYAVRRDFLRSSSPVEDVLTAMLELWHTRQKKLLGVFPEPDGLFTNKPRNSFEGADSDEYLRSTREKKEQMIDLYHSVLDVFYNLTIIANSEKIVKHTMNSSDPVLPSRLTSITDEKYVLFADTSELAMDRSDKFLLSLEATYCD